jgi:nicotinamide-nucleotide amidase
MTEPEAQLNALAERVGQLLLAREARVTTAESCTGGWIAKCLTDVPGSSQWFEYGFVTYGDAAKESMLAVDTDLINRHGAVSREVVQAMAVAARAVSDADIAVAVSGIAGPDGGSEDKPVGTVWLAWLGPRGRATSRQVHFDGDREDIRRQTVIEALNGVLKQLADG